MTSSSLIDSYYIDATKEYENSNDANYHNAEDNIDRVYLINRHAKWLYLMNDVIRIWE